MSKSTYFIRGCPTCGRRLQIRVEYLGRSVVCQHCGGRFTATDPTNPSMPMSEATDPLLDRVEELLQNASDEKATRSTDPH